MTVAAERLLDGYEHLRSAAEIIGVLNQLPQHDVEGLELVVLHQRWYARPEREREEFADGYATRVEDVVLQYLETSAGLA